MWLPVTAQCPCETNTKTHTRKTGLETNRGRASAVAAFSVLHATSQNEMTQEHDRMTLPQNGMETTQKKHFWGSTSGSSGGRVSWDRPFSIRYARNRSKTTGISHRLCSSSCRPSRTNGIQGTRLPTAVRRVTDNKILEDIKNRKGTQAANTVWPALAA